MKDQTILLLFHLEIENKKNILRETYNSIQKKHPHSKILIWSLPKLFDLLQKRFKKIILGDLFITLFDHKPYLVYLIHPDYIDDLKVLDITHNSFKSDKKFGYFYREFHYETFAYSSHNSSLAEIDMDNIYMQYVDFELFNQNLHNPKLLLVKPSIITSQTYPIIVSQNRPAYTCGQLEKILKIPPDRNYIFLDKKEIENNLFIPKRSKLIYI